MYMYKYQFVMLSSFKHGNITGQRNILSLTALCDNSSSGCEWVGKLRYLDKHMASCGFALLACPNECHEGSKRSKVVQLLRKDMKKHTQEECPRRPYECPHCEEEGEYKERMTTHLKECPMMEVPCPKRRCKESILRRDLPKHRRKCLFEKVHCKYSTFGCEKQVLRKDLAEHEGDTEQHLQMAIDTVHEQQITINKQKLTLREQDNMLANLRSTEMPMKYKLVGFKKLKSTNKEAFSPVFYTSPGGYKMCASVNANGNGEGRDTHVSVFACLMKGENDDHLPWPFTGTVTVELLNQLEDDNHYSVDITFPPDEEASQRVMDEETPIEGWGDQQFISHIDLSFNEDEYCQYLKNDCLYFLISADAESSTKPWLV